MKWREYREELVKDQGCKSELYDNELNYKLVREIVRYRKERNLTQKELAEIIGTKQSAISRLESGRMNPSVDFLVKVANALNMKLDIKFITE
ncbi:helix-turn-helix domain-containing protein [Crassaminicella profunda]|uniref:helix-turn-helix domain-containing protein n=1 Tax=Crassaminicella profunda TaxID=1286698 RepID=UPI001CA6881A|nr:helix-turn-helix transcriptional regulator [Crassaminicella profunda]QZY55781.1 helix-turn-helix transcriptional regulator [Crassaminicella profunda]